MLSTLLIPLWLVGISGLGAVMAQTGCPGALPDYRVALQSYDDGLFDPAIASFEAYLRRCPGGEYAAQSTYLLGEIAYKRQRFSAASHYAEQVLSRTTDTTLHPQAALLAGQALMQLGQPDKARAHLQRAVTSGAFAEVRQAALYWLGELALQLQQYDDARMHYQRLLGEQRTGPYAIHALYSLGWLARQRGDASAALEAFTAFLKLAPEHEFAPQVRFIRAELLRDTSQLQEAAEAFQQLAQNAATSLRDEALFWWAEIVSQQGRYRDARELYQRVLTAYPQSARVNASLYGWGWAALQESQCVAAVAPWEQLLQRDAAFPQALAMHYQLGICYGQLEQPAQARAHLQQVVDAGESTPYVQDALSRLAAGAFAQGNYEAAIHYATRALPLASQEDVARVHYLLGESYAALGKHDEALEHWQQVRSGPQTASLQAQAQYRIASHYVRQHAWEQALPILRQLWDNFPQFPERSMVAIQLAQAYRATQRCAEALVVYDALIDSTAALGEQRPSRVAKAFCLSELGRYAEVIETLSPLLGAVPPIPLEPRELYVLGQAHMQQRQYDEALADFSQLSQRFPTEALTAAAEPSLAFMLERAGRRGAALTVWRTYLRRDGSRHHDSLLQFQLQAGRLALQEKQFAEALDYLAPVRESSVMTLAVEALFWSGEAYFQQQHWELAHQVYQELLDRRFAEHQWSALARLRLGMIYEQQHEWERALQIYHSLLTVTTDAEVMANARQRIAAIESGRVPRPQLPSSRLSDG